MPILYKHDDKERIALVSDFSSESGTISFILDDKKYELAVDATIFCYYYMNRLLDLRKYSIV